MKKTKSIALFLLFAVLLMFGSCEKRLPSRNSIDPSSIESTAEKSEHDVKLHITGRQLD
jgi:hypothetical protein